MRIAFIGLGNMGAPMAANLMAASLNAGGMAVTGFDLSPAAMDTARALGIKIAGSIAEAIKGADIILTMLPSGQHVRKVWGEVVAALDQSTLLIDCSTIDVESAHAAHDLAAKAGHLSLDAPVSGGVGGAKAGTLTFMVGGTQEAYAKGQPILAMMGKKIVLCGEKGAGQAAKICNNMILGISMIAVSEGFVLAEKLGLSHQALFDVASTSSGQCWSLTSYCPVPGPVPTSPANQGYAPGFAAGLMLKDLTLAQEAASASGAQTPLGALARKLFEEFSSKSSGTDFSGIITMIRDRG
jgi:3-hydroxyisobutyrate dehydrogenase